MSLHWLLVRRASPDKMMLSSSGFNQKAADIDEELLGKDKTSMLFANSAKI